LTQKIENGQTNWNNLSKELELEKGFFNPSLAIKKN
jgi:hypothetical protein